MDVLKADALLAEPLQLLHSSAALAAFAAVLIDEGKEVSRLSHTHAHTHTPSHPDTVSLSLSSSVRFFWF